MDRITVRTRFNCKFCMGSGRAVPIFAVGETVCSCVLEQLRIVTTIGDPAITVRYSPESPEYMTREEFYAANRERISVEAGHRAGNHEDHCATQYGQPCDCKELENIRSSDSGIGGY